MLYDNRIPVLIALGDFTSGVTSWAFRLRESYVSHPRYSIRLVNCRQTGNKSIRFDHEACSAAAFRALVASFPRVVVVPNFVFDVYSLCVSLALDGHDLRTIGFCRADSEEEYYRPLRFFEPAINQFAAVSPECVARLSEQLPNRVKDITLMPTGVLVPSSLKRHYQTHPIRLVYGGRIVQVQKRVMDFVPLVTELMAREVDFTFAIAGQGRQLPDLQIAMSQVSHGGRVRFLGKIDPNRMADLWAEHDVFIQTSDFEGTSNSMLESMAQGTIPVMTRTESGVDGIIHGGENGFLVPVGDMAAMAEVVAGLADRTPEALARIGLSAHAVTREYAIERYVERFSLVLDRALEGPPPTWPEGRPLQPPFEVHGIHLDSDGTPRVQGAYQEEELLAPFSTQGETGIALPWTSRGEIRLPEENMLELDGGEQNTYFQQTCSLVKIRQGAWVEASIEACSTELGKLGFNCYVDSASGKKTYSASHSGHGQWETIAHRIPVPDSARDLSIRFYVVLRACAKEVAKVRRLSLRLVTPLDQVPDLGPFFQAPVPPVEPGQKRLLILFPSPLRGGAEDYCLTMAKGAIQAGWQVHAGFAPRQATASLIRDFVNAGVQYHPLDVVDVGPKAGRAVPRKRITRAWRLLRKVQPSVVLLELCGMQYGLGPMLACALRGIPAAVVFQMVREGVRFNRLARTVRACSRVRGQHYVAVSGENRRLVAQALGMREEKIRCIPNGADPALFERHPTERQAIRRRIRTELDIPETGRLLLTVGRLTHQKGHDLLVPVMPYVLAQHPDTWFVWAGEGPDQAALEQQVDEYGVRDHVRMLGRRDDIPDLLNAADLFVHPTRFEGQPFSMLEAMAASLPIVTTRASAICEVLDHRIHALLGKVEDIRELREHLLFALDHPDEMAAMARRAFERLSMHTEQGMIELTLALLGEISR